MMLKMKKRSVQEKMERRFELRDIGEKLQHWHASQGDPIYAVGSFFFDGDDYPDLDVVAQAKARLESDLRAFDGDGDRARKNGWGAEEREELGELVDFLAGYLKERGYVDV